VQAVIQQSHPAACYVHCAAHALNLTISKATEVQIIRNCFGIMSEVITFFRASSKRSTLLRHVIEEGNGKQINKHNITEKQLKRLCDTRWVERHDSVKTFCSLFAYIEIALGEIKQWRDSASATASTLLASISRADFVIAMLILNCVLAVTKQLSVNLQKINIDLMNCLQEVQLQTEVLSHMRQNDDNFQEIFQQAEVILGEAIMLPRLCGRQKNRPNTSVNETAVIYYKRTAYIPFLDNVLSQLKDRFLAHKTTVFRLMTILPARVVDSKFDHVKEAVLLYLPIMSENNDIELDIEDVKTGFLRWKTRWQDVSPDNRPNDPLSALAACDPNFFPYIFQLLQIFATLPVSTATPERTFSAMKLLKTYLRSRLSDDNLQGLAMAYINKNYIVNVDDVINLFALKNRRLKFN